MHLNDIELSRAAALVDGLRVLNDNNAPEVLNENGLAGLQQYVVERSTVYAQAYGVDFPDETLPESLIVSLGNRGKGRPSREAMERLQALAASGSYSRAYVEANETETDWSADVDDSEAYAIAS